MHQIIIVGGGAGGLELATRLGRRLGRRRRAAVTLVDRSRTHVWKPLLHEVAAGSMDVHQHQLDYLAQARWHHFTFSLGALEGLDRARREITVGAIRDDRGVDVIPRRTLQVRHAGHRDRQPRQLVRRAGRGRARVRARFGRGGGSLQPPAGERGAAGELSGGGAAPGAAGRDRRRRRDRRRARRRAPQHDPGARCVRAGEHRSRAPGEADPAERRCPDPARAARSGSRGRRPRRSKRSACRSTAASRSSR